MLMSAGSDWMARRNPDGATLMGLLKMLPTTDEKEE